jgi:hypothetical protein
VIQVIDSNSEEFQDLWAKAEVQLGRMLTKYPDDCDWSVGFVLAEIDDGRAGFLVCEEGFFVVREFGPYMEIWIGAAFEGDSDDLPDHLAELDALVKESGFSGLLFSTVRTGWEKRAPQVGFREMSRSVTYVFEGLNEKTKGSGDSGISCGEIASG